MTIIDVDSNITSNRFVCIDTATKKVSNISIINLPLDRTIYLLLSGTRQFTKTPSTNVTLCIICCLFYHSIRSVSTRQIEIYIITACHRDRNVGCKFESVTMSAITKIQKPGITTYMDVTSLISGRFYLS